MTKRRRRQVAWTLRGLALPALVAYLAGRQAAHSGGLVRVEQWFDRPLPLLGAAVALTVVSLTVELDFRTKWSQLGCAAGLVALLGVGGVLAFLSLAFSSAGPPPDRLAAPGRGDRVVTVTNVAFGVDPAYRVELRTGTGWSERHWDLGGSETYQGTAWTGPNEITVTREDSRTVYTLDPATGRPGEPRRLPR